MRELTPDEMDGVDTIAEADYQAALRYYDEKQAKKEKTAEPEIKFTETGLVGLDIKVPGLTPEKAKPIMRDVRRALENCGSLSLLDEFIITLSVEYIEVPVEGVE